MTDSLSDHTPIFRNVLLCDDVRKELGGKRTIVGVFSGDIVLEKAPGIVALATYIEFVPASVEDNQIEFWFLMDGKENARLRATLNDLMVGVVAVLDLPKIALQVDGPTDISIDAQIKGRDRQRLITKKILVGPL